MPKSANPEAPDHFVYVIRANGYPFYVGHGRAGRLSDRARFIDSLARLHPDRSHHKWTLHGEVVADLRHEGVAVHFDQITSDQTKAEAARHEQRLLTQLLTDGFLMSNKAGNRGAKPAPDIVTAVLADTKTWNALGSDFRPLNRYAIPSTSLLTPPKILRKEGKAPSSLALRRSVSAPSVRERVDPDPRLVLIDMNGRHRFLVQRQVNGEWKYVVGNGRSGENDPVSQIEDVIQRVIIDGKPVTAKTVGPRRPIQRSGVTVPGKSIRGYWLAPELVHLVRAAPQQPCRELPPER